ncbi:MAG: hypothetical protein JXA57_19335 [Armatimonadetes bacterium]|nr:hypothetical protein [Armatimonadota bacterium]
MEAVGGRSRRYEGEERTETVGAQQEGWHRPGGMKRKELEAAVERLTSIIDRCQVLEQDLLDIRCRLGLDAREED